MTSAAIATMLCYIMAMGMALPSKMAVSEDLKAESQWHLQAPSLGCVEISHGVGGSTFRSYACDDPKGPCVYSPTVNRCPTSALFAKPNLERIVNVRSRDHLFRYYNQIGGACRLSILPECCSKASAAEYGGGYTKSQDEECKCIDLPTGERICDPIDCGEYAKSQDEECKCVDLPTGERICDPIDCEGGSKQTQGHEAVIEALLKYITKKN